MLRLIVVALVAASSLAVACEQSPPAGERPATAAPADSPPVAPADPDPPAADSTPATVDPAVPTPTRAADLVYVERLLGGAAATDTLPMIVAIHGLGDTPDNFGHLLDTFPEPARLILPQGLDPTDEGGWSWFPIRARDADVEGLAKGISSAADRIAAAIEVLRAQRPTAGAPIVTGFSQGGMLTFTLAVEHPESVGAAFPIGGWLPPPLVPAAAPKGPHPAIHAFHGTDDRAVAYGPTEVGVQALEALGWQAQLHTYPGVGHAITPEIHRDVTDRLVDAVRAAAEAPR